MRAQLFRSRAIRRHLVCSALVSTAAVGALTAGCGGTPSVPAAGTTTAGATTASATTAAAPTGPMTTAWCRPDQPCWPTTADWQQLRSRLRGALEVPTAPWEACRSAPAGQACQAALSGLDNPFALQDQPGATQSVGWIGAWTSTPSAYAVVAESPDDIAAAVRFARDHHLRLVIKGTGHDYLGRSTAPDSLLIWTHRMRRITVHDAFAAQGCAAQGAIPAVSVEAGTRWLEAYQEVTGKHHRYVQGGGCTSVGAAGGFLQGGGFGSWSKKYGIAAAGLVEADVVTADGERVIANACQHADLFWALRGGGGGTFGVVTRVTLMTHPLPDYVGQLSGEIVARSDAAFQQLLEQFVAFYRGQLSNEHWGEQVTVKRNNTLALSLTFEGMRARDVEAIWLPFRRWVEARPDSFTIRLGTIEVPGDTLWNFDVLQKYAPAAIRADARSGEPPGHFWWAGDAEQVSAYWYAYGSRWIPLALFEGDHAHRLAAALFAASRHWTIGLHFNKGQAGASADAVERGRRTAMNPAVFDAAALVIVGALGHGVPDLPGHEPDPARAQVERAAVSAAMQVLRDVTPNAGSYVNETDYFEPNWQREFWGNNYPRLLAIKQKYDPNNLFTCHHCVGSEARDATSSPSR